MRKLGMAAGLSSAVLLAVAAPGAAQAHHYRHYHHYCSYARHRHAVAGTLVGGAAGGIIGNAITHGSVAGTVIGAGAGALTGHQIGKHSSRC